MPVGVLLPVVTGWNKIWKTVVMGVGFSLFIEIMQFITSRGCFDLDDMILNGLGTIIGFGIYRSAKKLFTKKNLNTVAIQK